MGSFKDWETLTKDRFVCKFSLFISFVLTTTACISLYFPEITYHISIWIRCIPVLVSVSKHVEILFVYLVESVDITVVQKRQIQGCQVRLFRACMGN